MSLIRFGFRMRKLVITHTTFYILCYIHLCTFKCGASDVKLLITICFHFIGIFKLFDNTFHSTAYVIVCWCNSVREVWCRMKCQKQSNVAIRMTYAIRILILLSYTVQLQCHQVKVVNVFCFLTCSISCVCIDWGCSKAAYIHIFTISQICYF